MNELHRVTPDYHALVVENELEFRSELVYVVESLDLGISVVAEASDFESARERLEEGDIDLLITDINLTDSARFDVGDRDGLELAAHARERFDIPTVFLTAFADYDPAVMRRAAASDPIGFIQKQGDEIGSQTRDHLRLAMRRLDALRREREYARQLEDIAGHLGTAQLFVDDSGIIFDVNEEACTLLERSPGDLLDHHIGDLMIRPPRAVGSKHPVSRIVESSDSERRYFPSVAFNLPGQGLLHVAIRATHTEHLKQTCTLLHLRDLSATDAADGSWGMIEGNALVLLSISRATLADHSAEASDLSITLEVQSIAAARLPSSVVVEALSPLTIAIVLQSTTESNAASLIGTLLVELEKIVISRHPTVELHAGVAALGILSMKDTLNAAFSALEAAQAHPTRRIHRAQLPSSS